MALTAFSCCGAIAAAHFQNLFISPDSGSVRVRHQLPIPAPSPWRPPLSFLSLNRTTRGPSEKWDHTMSVLPCLAAFTQHHVPKFIHVVAYVRIAFLLKGERRSTAWTAPAVYCPMGGHLAVSTFWLLRIALLRTRVCKVLFAHLFPSVGVQSQGGLAWPTIPNSDLRQPQPFSDRARLAPFDMRSHRPCELALGKSHTEDSGLFLGTGARLLAAWFGLLCRST